jgi:hypothetical protein
MMPTRFGFLAALSAFCIAVNALLLPASAANVPGVSGLNVVTTNDTLHTPVAIIGFNWRASGQGPANYTQCIKERILSRKAVTDVRFTLKFQDQFGNDHGSTTIGRTGFFAAGTIWNTCFAVATDRFDTNRGNITALVLTTSGVQFSDGSSWNPGQSFVQAYLPNGTQFAGGGSGPARAPLNVAQNWADLGHSPIEVITSSTGYDYQETRPRQCVSFRNISGKVATDVQMSFTYAGASNDVLVTQSHDYSGTFTPPIEIDDKCAYVNLGAYAVATRIAHVDIHVMRVVFEDGTQWDSGQGFVRSYGNDGIQLGQAVSVAPSMPFTPNAPTGAIATSTAVYSPYTPTVGQPYVPASQPYVPAPVSQPYVPVATYGSTPQYTPTQTVQLPYALVGLTINNGNAIDRIVPMYAPIGAGFVLQQPVLGQAVGGGGGTPMVFQPPGYVLTGLDVYRGVYAGVDEVLGMKLYWNRLTPSGIDPNDGVTSTAMRSVYPQTFPMKVLRATPGSYISNIIITPSTHTDGRTFVHDINISLSPL